MIYIGIVINIVDVYIEIVCNSLFVCIVCSFETII